MKVTTKLGAYKATLITLGTLGLAATLPGCGNAGLRNLPIASAAIVHACAAAEANAYIVQRPGGGSGAAIESLELELGASSSGKAGIEGSGDGYLGGSAEAERGSAKNAKLTIKRLPTMEQCRSWGYVPQLNQRS
jgi:hypothetical protein